MNGRLAVRRETIRGDGPAIAVTTIGEGQTLILLHGIGSSSKSWLPIMSKLAAHFRLIMPDHRGHGASDKPDSGYLLPDYAADLERVIAWGNDKRPLILGHSLGGLTAITWAKSNPAVARAIVLEDMPLSGGPERAPMLEGWAALAALSIPEAANAYRAEFPDWSDDECLRRAEVITSTHQQVFLEMRDGSMRGVGVDYLVGLEKITSPVTLIHGDPESGGLVPHDGANRFADLAENFTAIRIPGGSHSLHRDKTPEFLAAFARAISKT
jgi:pimeloyl-ACP methyl ester carboxylesterase